MRVRLDREGATLRLTNDDVELVVATAFGPRVLAYRRPGGENVFAYLDPARQGKATPFGDLWHSYGGHRLWHAPEHPTNSYVPDNNPIETTFDGATLSLLRREPVTDLLKEIDLTLEERGSRVRVVHRITNGGASPVVLAPWALSVMAPGGQAVLPLPTFAPYPSQLLPVGRLVLWSYTRLHDARYRFGSRYLRIRQDPGAVAPQKLGLFDAEHGWCAYHLRDQLFVKRYAPARPDASLADLGANIEVFTDGEMLELETLGTLAPLAPGETATHVETWTLHHDLRLPHDDEEALEVLAPLVT